MTGDFAEAIQELGARSREAVKLAMYAALAAQIEPELLRALRLELVPDADAGCEADVWFSPLVQSAEPSGIVLYPEAVKALREEFQSSKLAGNLKRAFDVIEGVHANGPSALKAEETITYYALSDEPDKETQIEEQLKSILGAMEDPARTRYLARWAVQALPRLPADAQKNPAATVLNVGSSNLLDGREIIPQNTSQAASPLWNVLHKIVNEQKIARQDLWVRFTRQGVEFSTEQLPGAREAISVPRSSPLQVQVEWTQDGSRQVQDVMFPPGEPYVFKTTASEITLRTFLGEWYRLRPETYDVFVCYGDLDHAWVVNVLVPGLEQAGVRALLYENFESGVPFVQGIEPALAACRALLFVLSKSSLQDTFHKYTVELVPKLYADRVAEVVISVLREQVTIPQPIAAAPIVDASDPSNFEQALRQILTRLGVKTVETTEKGEPAAESQEARTVEGYLDFDLKILRLEGSYEARILASPRGTAQTEFKMPFTAEEIGRLLANITSVSGAQSKIDPRPGAAREFGSRLFEAVFADQVRGFFFNSLASARNQNKGLRVRLDLRDVPELGDLPWELFYESSTNRFLALSEETPLVRFDTDSYPVHPVTVTPPLRILVMISEPDAATPLDAQRDWIQLRHALEGPVNAGLIQLDLLENASSAALERQLRSDEYHVLYIFGQGGVDPDLSEGVILLEDEQGRAYRVRGKELGGLVRESASLQLVVLNIDGAETNRQTGAAIRIARDLLGEGVPSAVAMQFGVSDRAKLDFHHIFFRALAENAPLDAAVLAGRIAIHAGGNEVEWAAPVLYTGAPETVIFDVRGAAPNVEQQAKPERAEATPAPQAQADLPPTAERFLAARFEGHELTQPLQVGEVYTLAFSIEVERLGDVIVAAPLDEQRIFASAPPASVEQAQSTADFPLPETLVPQQVELMIQLLSDDFEILTDPQRIVVPRIGRSRNRARFDIVPKRNGVSQVTAIVLQAGNAVQSVQINSNVGEGQSAVAGGETPGRPIQSTDAVRRRDLTLLIDYVGSGFKVSVIGIAGVTSFTIPMQLQELEQELNRARAALQGIVDYSENGTLVYQIGTTIARQVRDKTLPQLARAGFLLFQSIFLHTGSGQPAREFAQRFRELARQEPLHIQIISKEMTLPWGMMYLAERFDPNNIQTELFLGLKHSIEHAPMQPAVGFPSSITAQPQLTVSLNLNVEIDRQMGFPLVGNQQKYWDAIQSRENIRLITRTSGTQVLGALADANTPDQIMYFYCHATSGRLTEGGPRAARLQFGSNQLVTLEDMLLSAPPDIKLAGSPLVFMNVSESAELSPLFYNGFLPYFLDKGARGMIGTQAPVPALFASEYAQKFFDQFLAGKPLGQVMLDLTRDYFFKSNNILGLLYGLYADADTRIVWSQPDAAKTAD